MLGFRRHYIVGGTRIQTSNMDNHPDSEQILAFSRRVTRLTLDPEEILRIDLHLEACASCRDRLAALRTEAIVDPAAATKVRHLSYQQIKAMVQIKAGVQNSPVPEAGPELEEHLRSCDGCRDEIAQLHAFATMLNEPKMLAEPEMLAAPEMPAERAADSRTSWWRAWFAAPAWKWAPGLALVAILAIGVAELAPVTRTLSAQLAGAERISDGGFGYMLDARGDVLGWPGLPDSYRKAIRAAARGQRPSREISVEDAQKRFGASHLIMGVAYCQAGMTAEAQAEFEQLKRANPQAKLVDRLLDSCKRR